MDRSRPITGMTRWQTWHRSEVRRIRLLEADSAAVTAPGLEVGKPTPLAVSAAVLACDQF